LHELNKIILCEFSIELILIQYPLYVNSSSFIHIMTLLFLLKIPFSYEILLSSACKYSPATVIIIKHYFTVKIIKSNAKHVINIYNFTAFFSLKCQNHKLYSYIEMHRHAFSWLNKTTFSVILMRNNIGLSGVYLLFYNGLEFWCVGNDQEGSRPESGLFFFSHQNDKTGVN
jgi:hypothetical protein